MKASLTAFVVLAAVLVAMGPWASGQILLDGAPSEGRFREDTTLIDDVDREAQRRAAEERAARQRTLGQLDSGPVGRYAVAASDKSTVLVDTMTGRT